MDWIGALPAGLQDYAFGSTIAIFLFVVPTAILAWRKRRNPLLWAGLAFLNALIPNIKLVPLPLLYLFFSGREGSETSLEAKRLAQGARYAYFCKDTGLAVDTDKRIVRLQNGRSIKEYAFAEVREWRSNIVSGGQLAGMGGYAGIAIAGQNARIERENRKETGLFLKVKDLDRPEWRIDMPNRDHQVRWMEILQQTINES